MKKSLLLSLMLILHSCNNSSEEQSTVEIKNLKVKQGRWYHGFSPFTGTGISQMSNGQVIYHGQWLDGKKNGLHTEWWYYNGKKSEEARYKNGELDGPRLTWYDNGQIWSIVNFKNGKWEGKSKVWYDNGQIQSIASMQNHKRHGAYTEWYENGQMRESSIWRNGERIEWKAWDENGTEDPWVIYKKSLYIPD